MWRRTSTGKLPHCPRNGSCFNFLVSPIHISHLQGPGSRAKPPETGGPNGPHGLTCSLAICTRQRPNPSGSWSSWWRRWWSCPGKGRSINLECIDRNSTHGLAYTWNSFIQDLNISQLLCVNAIPFLSYLVAISVVFCQLLLSSFRFPLVVFFSKSFLVHKPVRLTPASSRAPQWRQPLSTTHWDRSIQTRLAAAA